MKLLSRILILSIWISFATSQSLNLKMSDRILSQSCTKLRASQSKLAKAMFTFAETARNTDKKASTSARKVQGGIYGKKLSQALTDFANTCVKLQSVQNHDMPKNSTTDCYDINLKINLIENNLRSYDALIEQANVNKTLYLDSLANVNDCGKIENATADFTNLTSESKIVLAAYDEYIKNLQTSKSEEEIAKSNYVNWRRGKCRCNADSQIVGSPSIASLTKIIFDTDNSIKSVQSSIKYGISAANIKISAAMASNLDDFTNYQLQQLQSLLKKASTCGVLPKNLTAPTSCRELMDIVGRAQFARWYVQQNGYVAERNCSAVAGYLGELKRKLRKILPKGLNLLQRISIQP